MAGAPGHRKNKIAVPTPGNVIPWWWGIYLSYVEYRPTVVIRILVWFGIYFSGSLPMVLLLMKPGVFIFFPLGLLFALTPVLPQSWTNLNSGPGAYIVYAFYGIHLFLSLLIPSPKVFRILMIALVVVVLLNLYGCASLYIQASQHRSWS